MENTNIEPKEGFVVAKGIQCPGGCVFEITRFPWYQDNLEITRYESMGAKIVNFTESEIDNKVIVSSCLCGHNGENGKPCHTPIEEVNAHLESLRKKNLVPENPNQLSLL